MSDLTTFDLLVLAAVGLFAALGLMRGFVTEILTLLSWVAGFIAVNLFFDEGRAAAETVVGDGAAAAIFAVLGLFFGVFLIGKLLSRLIGGRVKNSVIGPVDRVLGMGFGAVKGLLLSALVWAVLSLAFDVAVSREDRPLWLADSKAAPVLGLVVAEVEDFIEARRQGRAEEEGYDRRDRDALDALFENAGEGEL